jgi:alpha-1,6-mannosyltransferase
MSYQKKSFVLLLTCGLITELFYVLFAILNEDRNIPLFMFIYFESFVLFFFAYFLITKKHFDLEKHDDSNWSSIFVHDKLLKILGFKPNEKSKLKIPFLIIALALVFRLTLLSTSYTTSDDVHRYLWEGKVLVNGYNPYTMSPDDSRLILLHDENYEKVTFKQISAIYPPLSQVVFAVNYLIAGNSTVFLKMIYLIFEFITLIFILKLLVLKGKDPKLILLYAWLPLPILEYFNNAHLDVVGISFLMMFIYYLEKNKITLSASMLALAFLTKLLALLILPLVIKKLEIKKSLIFYSIFLITCLVFYLPFIYGNPDVLGGLFRYLEHWEFNGSVYNLFKFIFARGDIPKMVCVVLLSFSVLVISFRYKDFISGVFAIFLCILIFSTTLYPWYLGWIAALNVFNPFYSVLSLFFTINFSNLTPLAPKWKEYPIVWIIEYIPFYGLLFYDLWKRKALLKDKD